MNYTDYATQGQTQLMTLLEKKLSAKEWQEADQLTKFIMIKTSNRKNEKDEDYVSLDINNFPNGVLHEIDDLWQEYSDDHFGFTSQKRILRSRNYQDFITNVGWYKKDSWSDYSSLSFVEKAPKGHLPYCGSHFWEKVRAIPYVPSSYTHHTPHYHAPHSIGGHKSGGEGVIAAGTLGATLVAAVPWVLGVAAVAGAGYFIYRAATKEEREERERLERIEAQKRETQQKLEEQKRKLEEENKLQKNIESLLSLV